MMDENPLLEKSYKFALRMVRLSQYLGEEKKEFVIAKEILLAGTSIGAQIEVGIQAEFRSDSRNKLAAAQKAAAETHFWLRLLRDSEYLTGKLADSLINDCTELQKLLTNELVAGQGNG